MTEQQPIGWWIGGVARECCRPKASELRNGVIFVCGQCGSRWTLHLGTDPGSAPSPKRLNSQDLIRRRDEILETMKQLTDDWCHELARRSRMEIMPDGYSPTSGGGNTNNSGISNPTEASWLNQWIEQEDGTATLRKPPADPQQQAGERLYEALGMAHKQARTVRRMLTFTRYVSDGRRGRESVIQQCQACHRDVSGAAGDRLRSGYCDRVAGPPWSGCYRHWLDMGRPDRPGFERWVQGEVERVKLEAVAAR